jgi:hypothetical protein
MTQTNDIRAIKPPLELPNEWAWLWWTLAGLVLLASAIVAWVAWRKRRQMPLPVVVIPAHVRAKQKLAEALAWITDANKFCTIVADTIRVYLEERFELRAPERTTEEFLVELQSSRHLTRDQKETLGDFLRSCDLVKFARFEPTEAALRQLHEAALRLVDETQFDPIVLPPAGRPPLPSTPAPAPSPSSSPSLSPSPPPLPSPAAPSAPSAPAAAVEGEVRHL